MATNWIRRLRRTVGLVWAGLVVALLGLVALSTLAPHLGATIYIIRGGSMAPAIPLGAIVADVPVDPASLAVGDVITVRTPTAVVYTHRIVGIDASGEERQFLLQGDANPDPDGSLVPGGAIVGKVTLFAPIVGYLLALLSLPTGILSVMSMLGSLLLSYWLLEDLELAERVATGTAEPSTDLLPELLAGPFAVGSVQR